MNELTVIEKNNILVIDSREVAKILEVRHDHLVRDIEKYIEAIENSETPILGFQNFFIESIYTVKGNNKKYKKYSLGMKQRLGIAAAIMEKPEIVILDEPTNSLDEDGVDLVKHIVRNEKERGALVVVSCHDEEILKGMSDEVFLLEQGRLIGHITEEDKWKRK